MTAPVSENAPRETADRQFLLDLDGFDGPIDLLLQLARDEKIDLVRLSIARLAEQYIAFVERAQHLRFELAADYLVMAAWLAYLKSRLLVPQAEDSDEPTAEELAEALALQLRRLEAVQLAARELALRPRLGSSVLPRGMIEPFAPSGASAPPEFTLFQLLDAYATCRRKADRPEHYEIPPLNLDSVEIALDRLSVIIGSLPDWTVLTRFLPGRAATPLRSRAEIAATFGASLELVKQGVLDLRQDSAFGTIYVRSGAAA